MAEALRNSIERTTFSRRTTLQATLIAGTAALVTFGGATTVAQDNATPVTETDDTAAIAAVIDAYSAAVKAADATAVVALFTETGVFFPYNAPTASGSEQLLATYEYLFSALALDLVFTIAEIVVSGDVAFATTSSEGVATVLAQDVTAPEINRELFTFARVDGQWLISNYMYNKSEAPAT